MSPALQVTTAPAHPDAGSRRAPRRAHASRRPPNRTSPGASAGGRHAEGRVERRDRVGRVALDRALAQPQHLGRSAAPRGPRRAGGTAQARSGRGGASARARPPARAGSITSGGAAPGSNDDPRPARALAARPTDDGGRHPSISDTTARRTYPSASSSEPNLARPANVATSASCTTSSASARVAATIEGGERDEPAVPLLRQLLELRLPVGPSRSPPVDTAPQRRSTHARSVGGWFARPLSKKK